MEPWRPDFELNVEGYFDERLLEIAAGAGVVDAPRPLRIIEGDCFYPLRGGLDG
jgi:hypothetical protein